MRHCGKMYWLSAARQVGQVERWVKKPQKIRTSWRSAEHVQEPDEFEYYQAIRSGLARTREQKFRLRSCALRRSNDAYRDPGAAASNTTEHGSPERDENLRALTLLADESNEQELMMKAEAYRELSMWPEAAAPSLASGRQSSRSWSRKCVHGANRRTRWSKSLKGGGGLNLLNQNQYPQY